jgi:acyl dehydratase
MSHRQFTLQDQNEFSKLSGDYNPIHIDPVSARRYMFGKPIVHGVHSILWALEIWCKTNSTLIHINSLEVSFLKPISLDARVDYHLLSETVNHFEIELISESIVNTRLVVNMTRISKEELNDINIHAKIIDAFPEHSIPTDLPKEKIKEMSGKLDLYIKKTEKACLFPFLDKCISTSQIAVILSTTRLVGMECPGLYSIFSSFELYFNNVQTQISNLRYEVKKFDDRFGLIYINLNGFGISGNIKSFLRPAPVQQSPFTSFKNIVTQEEFLGQRALIIGGSRGLGEVTAKLLAAGGATVRITYFHGELDARSIVNEIVSNGGQAEAFALNIQETPLEFPATSSTNWVPTHCYYFATPFIFSGNKGVFSEKLFLKFCSYYLTGFNNTVDFWQNKSVNKFFYPSTTAIDELPDNMIEYTLSKSAGEKLCEFLLNRFSSLHIYKPRFPRMATDQTASLMLANNEDPVLLTLNHLRSFHSST